MRLLFPLFLLSCTSGDLDSNDSHGVTVRLVNPTTADPMEGVAFLEIRLLSEDGGDLYTETFGIEDELSVPNLDYYGVIRFELIGYDDDSTVVSFGRSAEIAVVPNVDRTVQISFLPINQVLPLSSGFGEERSFHSTTKAPDGRVLLVGGLNTARTGSLSSIEYYEPATGRFTTSAQFLSYATSYPSLAWTSNEELLVSGGYGVVASTGSNTANLNLINPASGEVRVLPSMGLARRDHCFKVFAGEYALAVSGTAQTAQGVEAVRPDPATGTNWTWESYVPTDTGFQAYNVQSCGMTDDGRIFFQGTGSASTGLFVYGGPGSSVGTGFSRVDYSLSESELAIHPYGANLLAVGPSLMWIGNGALNLDGDQDIQNDVATGFNRLFDMDTGVFVYGTGTSMSDRVWGVALPWIQSDVYAFACGGETADILNSPNQLVEIVDLANDQIVLTTELDRRRPGCSMDVLDDGSLLITGGNDPGAEVFDGGAILVPYLD